MFLLKLFQDGREIACVEFKDLEAVNGDAGDLSLPPGMLAGFVAGLAAAAAVSVATDHGERFNTLPTK